MNSFPCKTLEKCGDLDENGPIRLTYLKAWFPVSKYICEELGGVVLLK